MHKVPRKTVTRKPTKPEGTHRCIGHERVYTLQDLVANEALERLLLNELCGTVNRRSPIVILQPQAGKTGVIESFIERFIDDCVARGRTFQIVVLCGLPHLVLTEQTRDRLTESVIDGATPIGARLHVKAMNTNLTRYPGSLQREGLLIYHNSSPLRRLNLDTKVDVRLWIGDEVHMGNVKNGNIDLLLQHHGVHICEQIHRWDHSKTTNHFLGVSATPSAHLIKSDNIELQGDALFHCIYKCPPAEYNSLSKMKKNGRLRATEPLFRDKASTDPSAFFDQVLSDFRKACRTQGAGHLVVRATGQKHDQLIKYVNRDGGKIEFCEFDTENNNIGELNSYLSVKPSEPTIVVIRGSMRAGITIGLKHYIRGWVETESTNSDAPTQSGAGRACGYGRNSDTYPIYCDLARVDHWIRAYEDLDGKHVRRVPRGVQNSGTTERKYYGIREILPYKEAVATYVEPNKSRYKETRSSKYRTQISATSGNVFNDVAGWLLEGRRDSGSTLGIYVDGPLTRAATEKYIKDHDGSGQGLRKKFHAAEEVWGWYRRNRESYKKLVKKFPEAVGKAIIFDQGSLKMDEKKDRDAYQKTQSATRKK